MKQTKNVFPNLAAELTRAGLDVSAVAAAIGKSKGSVYSKFNGKSNFDLSEMEKIKTVIETKTANELTLDYLFTRCG